MSALFGYLRLRYMPPNSCAVMDIPMRDFAGPMTTDMRCFSTPKRIERLSSNPEKKPNAEDMKDMFLTQFAFMLLTGIFDSMLVVFVSDDGKREKSGYAR